MEPVKITCAHCAAISEADPALPHACPGCGKLIAPGNGNTTQTTVCPVCMTPVSEGDELAECSACQARYHKECWQDNGGCAIYGCSAAPTVEPRRAIEIPVSYWGQEKKPCPACGQEILAAAVRCRMCGATFTSARPQDSAEFQQQAGLTQRLPVLRTTVIWIFIVCVLPCSAPIGAVWGLVWYPGHRDDVNALPSMYSALVKIGIGVGIAESIGFVVMTLLYNVVRH